MKGIRTQEICPLVKEVVNNSICMKNMELKGLGYEDSDENLLT